MNSKTRTISHQIGEAPLLLELLLGDLSKQ